MHLGAIEYSTFFCVCLNFNFPQSRCMVIQHVYVSSGNKVWFLYCFKFLSLEITQSKAHFCQLAFTSAWNLNNRLVIGIVSYRCSQNCYAVVVMVMTTTTMTTTTMTTMMMTMMITYCLTFNIQNNSSVSSRHSRYFVKEHWLLNDDTQNMKFHCV